MLVGGAGSVARVRHRLANGPLVDGRLVVNHLHGVGHEAHLGLFHPLQLANRLFHMGGAGGAGHASHRKLLLHILFASSLCRQVPPPRKEQKNGEGALASPPLQYTLSRGRINRVTRGFWVKLVKTYYSNRHGTFARRFPFPPIAWGKPRPSGKRSGPLPFRPLLVCPALGPQIPNGQQQ